MATFNSPQSYLKTAGELADPDYPLKGEYLVGGYASFDGVASIISFFGHSSSTLDFQPGDIFSISFWYLALEEPASRPAGFIIANCFNGVQYGWSIHDFNGILRLMFTTTAGYEFHYAAVPRGSWHHALWVVKPESGVQGDTDSPRSVSLYIDGAPLSVTSSGAVNQPVNYDSTPTITSIGAAVGTYFPPYPHLGNIAEVAIWNTDQSGNVVDIYNGRIRHNLMQAPEPPSLFYCPLTSYGDNPDPAAGPEGVYEAILGVEGLGENLGSPTPATSVLPTVSSTSVWTKVLDTSTDEVAETRTENVFTYAGGTGGSFPI